ncbi:MAG: FHA domain-containing protein [Gammaproteobacteria bacterium]
MAKFTVYFKEKALQTALFDSGVVHIGRDDTNDITLDSLAVAPAHAAVVIKADKVLIKQLNDNFPLIVNGEKVKETSLNNNDKITLGKHFVVYNTAESVVVNIAPENPELKHLNQEIERETHMPEANLQVMDGDHIGRIIPMKKAMTRLGRNGGGVAVIARRKDGYFISALENSNSLMVNRVPLGDKTLKLHNNDVIVIDATSLQFFQLSHSSS